MSTSRNTSRKTPFCAVCKAAGKSETTYTSHYVKNLQGKVTCMTLLSQRCETCNHIGHTKKYCLAVSKLKEKVKVKNTTIVCCATPTAIVTNNRFKFDDDDNDDNDDHVSSSTPAKKTYACVVATAAAAVAAPRESLPVKEVVIKTKKYLSWADADSDSDSD